MLVEPPTHEYELVTPAQQRQYKPAPPRNIVRGIALASKMKKFTSEICLHQAGKFYAVDHINTDPDMNTKSFYANGVPDEVVRHVVWLLFYEARCTWLKGDKGSLMKTLVNRKRIGTGWNGGGRPLLAPPPNFYSNNRLTTGADSNSVGPGWSGFASPSNPAGAVRLCHLDHPQIN